jgi:sulfur relay protein TusB/DsrH
VSRLYLLSTYPDDLGLSLATADGGTKVALLQDGVFLDCAGAVAGGAEVSALRSDAERRGDVQRMNPSVRLIDYGELVALIVENKVFSFA